MATPPIRKIFRGSCPDCPWKQACQVWRTAMTMKVDTEFKSQMLDGGVTAVIFY